MSLLVNHSRHFLDALRGRNGGKFINWCSSAAAVSEHKMADQIYRTSETNTRLHNEDHIGKFFTADPKVVGLFGVELNTKQNQHAINYFAPRDWYNRNAVFGETCIMVRRPAVEIINCINNSDLSKPALRYVLYGLEGNGKSITLSHLICYGYQQDFVVMPFAWIKKWMTKYYEVAPSSHNPGHIDHIVNSNIFLKNFRQANMDRLQNCVTHKDYSWSARDKVKAGSPLLDVVDLGCDRLTFAADALNVLIRELKLNCNDGNCKLMVLIDGVNSLFCEHTMIHREKRFYEPGPYKPWEDWMQNVATVDECTVLRNIKKLLNNDYNNAVVVTSVDRGAQVKKTDPANKWWDSRNKHMEPDTTSHLPFALLGERGWSALDPFVPVEVEPYSAAELDSAIDYYVDKRWIREEAGNPIHRKELHFLTGRSPADFFNFSNFF